MKTTTQAIKEALEVLGEDPNTATDKAHYPLDMIARAKELLLAALPDGFVVIASKEEIVRHHHHEVQVDRQHPKTQEWSRSIGIVNHEPFLVRVKDGA